MITTESFFDSSLSDLFLLNATSIIFVNPNINTIQLVAIDPTIATTNDLNNNSIDAYINENNNNSDSNNVIPIYLQKTLKS